jgi:hypothetical protein
VEVRAQQSWKITADGAVVVPGHSPRRSEAWDAIDNPIHPEDGIRADDFAFIGRIWADWSPGCDASEDLGGVGLLLGSVRSTRFGSPSWAAEQAAAWGCSLIPPTVYLHGTNDGCHGMSEAQVDRVPDYCGKGPRSELIGDVGHFMMVERPWRSIAKSSISFRRGEAARVRAERGTALGPAQVVGQQLAKAAYSRDRIGMEPTDNG